MVNRGGRSKQERKRKNNNNNSVEDTNKLFHVPVASKMSSPSKKTPKTNYDKYIEEKETKQKIRKLENIKKRKDQKKERFSLYEKLKLNQILPEQLASLASSTMIGQLSELKVNTNSYEDKGFSSDESITLETLPKKEETKKSIKSNKSADEISRTYHIVHFKETSSSEDDQEEVEIDSKSKQITNENTLTASEDIVNEVELINSFETPIKQNSPLTTKPGNPLTSSFIRKPSYILVNREPAIQKMRLQLPILGEEQMIMEEITNNDIVIISGETGSGKTTQLPQFLYEAGYSNKNNTKKHMQGMIGITEPRRVAAIAMSERVGTELGFRNNECSYKVRHDGTVSVNTQIKFMTDGVLIKEIENDFLLTKYSVIIIDEAHERSLHTDILLGLLSRIVGVRNKRFNPLKLIIMSATLQLEQFENNTMLFPIKIPPIIKISSRQYPVSIHFSRKTPFDYMTAAYNRVCKIHKKNNPTGSILVFVTSRREVSLMCKWLKERFSENSTKKELTWSDKCSLKNIKKTLEESSDENYDDWSDVNPPTSSDSCGKNESEDDDDDDDTGPTKPMVVFPLYANLSTEKQKLVFRTPPENVRHCIVATNVAETSITIPNVKYVVDTGKVKQRLYDSQSSATTFDVCWCSKASAEQRAGRAGRTGPGHCYRMYSSAVYQYDMPDFTEPDILRQPLESVILQMKCLGIARVEDFPFPTPPSKEAIKNAETLLIAIGALEMKEVVDRNDISVTMVCGVPTDLGREMAKLPVSPRYAVMLLKIMEHYTKDKRGGDIVYFIILLIASLSVRDLLLPPLNPEDERKTFRERKEWILTDKQEFLLGDFVYLIKLIGGSLYYDVEDDEEYCTMNGINYKSLMEVHNLIKQLKQIVKVNYGCDIRNVARISPPRTVHIEPLIEALMYGFPDHIARKLPRVIQNGHIRQPYQCGLTSDEVYMHPTCVLSRRAPTWILFGSLHQSSKLYLYDVCAISPEKLVKFESFCRFDMSKNEMPTYDANSDVVMATTKVTYGPHGWPLPTVSKIVMKTDTFEFYKTFTMFFLDGTMFENLKQFTDFLLYDPKNLTNTDRIYNKVVCEIIDSFVKENVNSKKDLTSVWKNSKYFLLDKYLRLLPETLQSKVESIWPPISP